MTVRVQLFHPLLPYVLLCYSLRCVLSVSCPSLCVCVCLSVWAWCSISSRCQPTCTPGNNTVIKLLLLILLTLNNSSWLLESCLTFCYSCSSSFPSGIPGLLVLVYHESATLPAALLHLPAQQTSSSALLQLFNKSFFELSPIPVRSLLLGPPIYLTTMTFNMTQSKWLPIIDCCN